jgi:hypothetical protein
MFSTIIDAVVRLLRRQGAKRTVACEPMPPLPCARVPIPEATLTERVLLSAYDGAALATIERVGRRIYFDLWIDADVEAHRFVRVPIDAATEHALAHAKTDARTVIHNAASVVVYDVSVTDGCAIRAWALPGCRLPSQYMPSHAVVFDDGETADGDGEATYEHATGATL